MPFPGLCGDSGPLAYYFPDHAWPASKRILPYRIAMNRRGFLKFITSILGPSPLGAFLYPLFRSSPGGGHCHGQTPDDPPRVKSPWMP